MADKGVIGYFVAGLLTAAALGGIYVLVEGPIGPMASGDDDPIVVAGGSLTIFSFVGFEKDPQDSFVANHKHTKREVSGGWILYNNGATASQLLPAGRVELEIAYCNGTCADPNNPDDKVTIKTNPNGKNLRISNTNSSHKIGDEAAGGSTMISHQPDWKVNRIRDVVRNADYRCDNGKCSVVLDYYCDNTGHCQ